MKKNYFCSIFKAFGILPTIILSLVLVFGVIVVNNPNILNIENVDLVKGCMYLLFVGTAVTGLSDLKSPKVGFVDFIRIVGFIGSLGATVISFADKLTVAPFVYLVTTIIFALELVARLIFAKEEANKAGFKKYNSAVANSFNPVLIGIVSIVLAIVANVLYDKLDLVYKCIDKFGISLAIMMLLVSLVVSTSKSNSKATLLDALLYVALYTSIITLICSFDKIGPRATKDVFIIFIASVASVILRGQSFEGDVVPSKVKINRYYADLYSKYDITISVVISAFLVGIVAIPAIKENALNTLLSYADINNIDLASMADILIYVGAGLALFLVVLLLIVRKFKSEEIKAVDKILNILGYTIMVGLPFVVISLFNIDFKFDIIFDSIPYIVILSAALVALLVCVILQSIRYVKYNAEVIAAPAEEAALEEATDEVAEEEVSEEVIEETAEEAPAEETQPEEVIYVDEQGNEIAPEDVEKIVTEEAPAEEVVEEVIYVDEQGNEIDPDDVPEEIREEHEPDEEDDDEEDDDEEEADEEPVVEEVVTAKEKDIVMPEVQIVDENGQPKKIKRKFNARMMFAPYQTKEYYNEIKNYLIMYRAKGRNSSRCETFRYKGLVAKVALAGKSIKVCLAIDPQSLQGSKYRIKDVSEKRQYVEVPTMIKVRSARGLKHFKELVDIMMAARAVKPKKNYQPTNFMPSLIPNGEAILGTLGMSTDYLYPTMNARGIPAELPDDLADYLPVIQGDELEGEEVEASVYLDTLCNHFVDGDEITIDVLKEVHIVNEGNVLRIKARGTLDRKLIIYAEYIDSDALKMLLCTNCTVVKIVR